MRMCDQRCEQSMAFLMLFLMQRPAISYQLFSLKLFARRYPQLYQTHALKTLASSRGILLKAFDMHLKGVDLALVADGVNIGHGLQNFQTRGSTLKRLCCASRLGGCPCQY